MADDEEKFHVPKKSKKVRSFEDNEISLLISEWNKYPCLYNKAHSDYHDRNKRDIAKEQIAIALNEELDYNGTTKEITAHDVQKKIENLRTYFGKEHGKEMAHKPLSGSGASEPFKSKWPWYESLKWLKDHMLTKESVSNLSTDSSQESDGSVSVLSNASWKGKRSPKLSTDEKLVKAAESIVEKIPTFNTMPLGSSLRENQDLNDDEHFGQMIGRKMMKLPEGETKETLKLEIQFMIKIVMFANNSQQYLQPPQAQYSTNYYGSPTNQYSS